jgi:hypothetical protein
MIKPTEISIYRQLSPSNRYMYRVKIAVGAYVVAESRELPPAIADMFVEKLKSNNHKGLDWLKNELQNGFTPTSVIL